MVNDGKGLQKTKKKKMSLPVEVFSFLSFSFSLNNPHRFRFLNPHSLVFPFSFSHFCSLVSLERKKTQFPKLDKRQMEDFSSKTGEMDDE